jgi:hypothetical protein
MNEAIKWLSRFWVWVTLGVFTIIALILFVWYWGDTAKTQAVSALFGFLATVLLVGMTAAVGAAPLLELEENASRYSQN